MPYKTTLIAGSSEERRYFLFRKTIEKLKREDTVIIPIGYWERFDIVIDDIVPLFDTTKGYLVPLLFELYKEKGVQLIIGTSRVSSDYLTPHILSLCSSIISTKLRSEMQSKLLFGTKGAENLTDNEYLMKRKEKITKGTLSECLKL